MPLDVFLCYGNILSPPVNVLVLVLGSSLTDREPDDGHTCRQSSLEASEGQVDGTYNADASTGVAGHAEQTNRPGFRPLSKYLDH